MFRKNPAFTIAAISALALGIGANTAIFTVVNAVLLKPLTYPDADRMVEFLYPSILANNFLTAIPEFHAYQRQTTLFKDVAAYDVAGPGYNLTGDRPQQLHGIHVSEAYFRLFGAPVLLGRTFTPQEDAPNGGKVVVLSYGLWQRNFAGDPAIVGKSLSLGNEPYTIIGVLGKDFLSDPQADIWLPFQFPPVSDDMNHFFQVAGRLQPGITLAQANAQLKVAARQYSRDHPKGDPDQKFAVMPLRDSIIGDARKSLLVLLGAVTLVLLIACANVANLLLVRATGRKREFAIRSALGAGRARIVRQLLTESILLSVTAGLLGMLLGFAGVRALLAISPAGLPRIGENGSAVGVDGRVLAFTLLVSLLTGIVFGLFPALTASRTDLNSALKESSNRAGTGFRQGKARSLLVVSEVSLALVLLIGSALLIRTFLALHGVGPGFDSHNVLTLEMSLNGERYQKTAGIAQLLRDGRNRLNALPGVESAAAAYWLPIQVEDGLPFQIIGRPVEKGRYGSKWMSISPGYLGLFKIPILRGRDFTENDTAAAPGVALINQSLAKQLWPNEDPLGQHVIVGTGHGANLGGRAGARDHRSRRRHPQQRPGPPARPDDDGPDSAGRGWIRRGLLRHTAAVLAGADPWRPAPVHRSGSRATASSQRRLSGSACPHHGRGNGPLHRAGELQHAAAHHLRRDRAGAGRDWHLRIDGLLRRAAHPGDGHPHGPGRGSLRGAQAGGLARHAAGADGRGGGPRRGVWPDAADCQLSVWGQVLGSSSICLCDADPFRRGAARRVAASHARLQSRPHAGLARGVIFCREAWAAEYLLTASCKDAFPPPWGPVYIPLQ